MTNTATFEAAVAKYAPRFQKELGLKGFHVDGMFGNFGHESAGLTKMREIGQPEGKGGYGWEQATGPRARALLAWAARLGLKWTDDEANVSFIINELKTTEAAALDALRRTKTRDEATQTFMEKDERPGVPALPSRIQWAEKAEKARIAAESKSLTDVPVPAPVADPNAALLAAVEGLYVKLLDFIAAEAVAKGIPQAAVSVVRLLLNQFDVPKLILDALLSLAAKKAA